MDMQVAKKKLGLKERYAVMTRGLDWTPSYQKMEDIYPYIAYEGIKIHDWDKWEDPFRLTMDAYWKYQAEKERKLYAIIDAFNQNNGHLSVTDARYINVRQALHQRHQPARVLMAHRGFAHAGRSLPRRRSARGLPDAVARRDPPLPRPRSTRSATTTSTTTACTIRPPCA
jgi:phenol hydroxylase P3 protein